MSSQKKGRRGGSVSIFETLEPRQLFSSAISGSIWNDANANKLRDAAEAGLSGWTVYLDQNRSRTRDAGESFTTTDANGVYRFDGLTAGTYYVAQETPVGWALTSPTTATSVTLGSAPVGPVTFPLDTSKNLINLDDFRNDPRFNRIDGTGYSVAVLDTGIDSDHPAFGADSDGDGIADRIVYQAEFGIRSLLPDTTSANDTHGHGTATTSVAAGSDPMYPGMAPGANIVALKVIGGANSGDWGYVERGLQWIIANHATYNIVSVNLSLGGDLWGESPESMGLADEFVTLGQLGIIVAGAAGNKFGTQGAGAAYPASDPNVISVGAVWDANVGYASFGNGSIDYTTGPDRITSYSQRSPAMLDIFAPGSIITAAAAGSGGFGGFQGTSMAAPHIAGAAVLAQQLAELQLGRRLTPGEFLNLIKTSGDTIFDGDDEDDNVNNTNAYYKRVNVQAMAEAIYDLAAGYPLGHRIELADNQDAVNRDLGVRQRNLAPAVIDLLDRSDSGASSLDNVTNLNGETGKISFRVHGTVAGALLKIYANGSLVGSVSARDYVTQVTLPAGVKFADGVVTFTATQAAPGLAESAMSPALVVTVDTTPDAAPAAPDLDTASDSGVSATDNLTNAPVLNFKFAQPGQYYLYRDGQAANWSSGLPLTALGDNAPLADGTYSYTARTRDLAGNPSPESAVTLVTVDRTAWPASSPGSYTMVQAPESAVAQAIGRRSDGKLVVGGKTAADTMILGRFNADGSVDMTFGVNGFVTPAALGKGRITDIEVLADNKILVGYVQKVEMFPSTDYRAMVARFNADGTLDTTFGRDGKLVPGADAPTAPSVMHRMADGRILLLSAFYNHVRVWRFTAEGQTDTTFFDVNGTSAFILENNVQVGGFGVATDGSVYIAANSPAGDRVILMKIKGNGHVDTSFDGDGIVYISLPARNIVNALLVQPDGKVLVGGVRNTENSTATADTLLLRFNPNGTLDHSFGNAGIVVSNLFTDTESMTNLQLDSQGRIVASYAANRMAAARFTSSGLPDESFGPQGTRIVPAAALHGYANDMVIAPDGTIILAGWATLKVNDPSQSGLTIARLPAEIAAPPAPRLQPASDTGVSNSDGVTADTTPSFDIPLLPGGHYFRVFANGVQISSDYLPGWSDPADPFVAGRVFTAPSLADGTYAFSIVALDAAGNASGRSSSHTVTIQSSSPTASIVPVSPDPRDTAVNSIVVQFSTAVQGFTTAQLSLTRNGVALNLGGVSLGTSDNKTWTVNGLASLTAAAGQYQLTITGGGAIKDLDGVAMNGSTSEGWLVNVATTPPAMPTNFTVTPVIGPLVHLAWRDNAVNESGYEIRRSLEYSFTNAVSVTVYGSDLAGYTDTTAKANTWYFYRVRAINTAGASDWTSRIKIKTLGAGSVAPTLPAAPGSPSAVADSSSQITVTWADLSGNESGFRIRRSATADFATYSEFTVGANVTSFASTALSAATTYYYRVQAFNSAGSSGFSTTVSATTQAAPAPTLPTAPHSVKATVNSATQVTFTWSDASSNETGFRIHRSTSPDFAGYVEFAVGANLTQYIDTNLQPATTYFYRLQAYNNAGGSAFSGAVNATTQAAVIPTLPAAPGSPQVQVVSSSILNFVWSDLSGNETGFRIHRSLTSNFASYTEFTVAANVTSLRNTQLGAGVTYYYRVQAYNDLGASAFTSTVSATTPGTPAGPLTAPSGLWVVAARNTAALEWTDNATSETGFEIQISTVWNFKENLRTIYVSGADVQNFTVTGLNAYTWYFFRVRAVNGTTASAWSSYINRKTTR